MERKKYKKPNMSEALHDMTNLIGCTIIVSDTDNLSRREASLGQTSSDDENERSSLFSKFTSTKRPAGFFGTQPGEIHNHTGEINRNSK